jgi:hypothetical protein
MALDSALNQIFGSFLRRHIDRCPRCSQRLIRVHRVNMAFALLKSSPHSVDLLKKANTAALNMLKHSLRFAPAAEKLRTARPKPKWTQRYGFVFEKALNAAACLLIVVLVKFGADSFLKNVREDGTKVMHNYYARNLGQEMADELMDT